MPNNTDPPPSLIAVLALRPPLATSTRTDLAPSFKLLRSLVNTVYGASGSRGLEPGLWRAQLARAAQRAGDLIQAVWSKLGGEGGVIVDDEGEGGRGVMRLQGVISDLQIFAGSLTSVQDPLSTFLLDSTAFNRTQATVTSLIKKLAALVPHYKVNDLISTPVSGWAEEDKLDKEEDIAALPFLIAKSRPNRAVLRQFEDDLAQREQTEADGDPDISSDQISTTTSGGLDASPASSRRTGSYATSGFPAAKRSEFLRFVYSQNPNLVGSSQDLDTAVAAGSVAVSTMNQPPPPRTIPTAIEDSSRSSLGKQSLVQQRISNFVTSANASPPLPGPILPTTSSRRIASDSSMSSTTPRRTWTVDMSGLNAVRRSSGSFTRPTPQPPQVSITGPPTRWQASAGISIKSRTSSEDAVPESDKRESKVVPAVQPDPIVPPVSDAPTEDNKPPSIASFAEQAAAMVAARNRRIGASTSGSWTKPATRPSSSLAQLPPTPEKQPTGSPTTLPSPLPTLGQPIDVPVETIQSDELSTSSLSKRPSSNDSVSKSNEKVLTDRAPYITRPPVRKEPSTTSSITTSTPSSSVFGSPGRILANRTLSPTMNTSTSIERPGTALSNSNASCFSFNSNRPAVTDIQPDFELVADLIEDHSLLDVIVGPPSPKEETLPEVLTSPISDDNRNPMSDNSQRNFVPKPKPSASAAEDSSSLADLLERATMFESWETTRPVIEDEREKEDDSTIKNTLRSPRHNPNKRHSMMIPAVQLGGPSLQSDKAPSVGSLSPPMSTRAPLSPPKSVQMRTPLSPPLTASSMGPDRPIKSSPVSPRPSMMSLQPFDALQGGSYSSGLRVGESSSPTRSLSGQSWATSLMSASPAPPDFDLMELTTSAHGHLFNEEPGKRSGWRILSLDGGGIRGLSMLFVVRSLLERVKKRAGLSKVPLPCECFNMICGVGTGGIIALLLGRLHLEIEDAIDAYLSISRNVFGQGKGALAILLGKSRYSASKLENAMQDVIERTGVDGRVALSEPNTECRTFVMAMRMSEGARGTFRTLRSYPTRQVLADRCSIYQAARATSASPLFFKPINLGDLALSSVPRSASLNNPSLEAVTEARSLFPDRAIDCLISLGAGQSPDRTGSVGRACAEIADACENAASAVETVAGAEDWADCYQRFNVVLNGEAGGSEWEFVRDVLESTIEYLDRSSMSELVERSVEALAQGIVDSPPGSGINGKSKNMSNGTRVRTTKISSSSRGEDRPALRPSLSHDAFPESQYAIRAFPSTGSLKLPHLSFD